MAFFELVHELRERNHALDLATTVSSLIPRQEADQNLNVHEHSPGNCSCSLVTPFCPRTRMDFGPALGQSVMY